MWTWLHFTQVRLADLEGYRRRFTLKIGLRRGSHDYAALMLSLEPQQGRCNRLTFRIKASSVHAESAILWRRKMLRGRYSPAMVPMVTPQGPISALAFVSNPSHPSYVGELPLMETASLITSGKGILGTNREYLVQLATQLEVLGIEDPYVRQLSRGSIPARHPDASAGFRIIAIVKPAAQRSWTPRTIMGKPRMTEGTRSHYEVIVVGAGVAGIYQIKRLADLGVDALVLDAAPDLGGTWYWNRYPGARFDLRATPTVIPFRGNCSTSGTGRNASRPSPRICVISITSRTSSTCANTCSSTARSRRPCSTRRIICGA